MLKILLIIASIVISACNNNNSSLQSNDIEERFYTELQFNDDLGDIRLRISSGRLLWDDKITEVTLKIINQEYSGDGVYSLYDRGGETLSSGRQYTLRGDVSNPDATLYQLIDAKNKEVIINLLRHTPDTLHQLDSTFRSLTPPCIITLKSETELVPR